MISYREFGALRLSQFLPITDIVELENWEFMDQLWIGEAVGFSEWLRLEAEPATLRSLSLDFSDLPISITRHILDVLGLAIRPGTMLADLQVLLGEPFQTHVFTSDRVTYEFAFGSTEPYTISCTVWHTGGLMYLLVMTPLPEYIPTEHPTMP